MTDVLIWRISKALGMTKVTTTIEKTGTQHRAIYNTLLTRIRRGDYSQDSKLPTERDLVREFKVSRITIVRALNDLARDGFVWRKQGSGSYVSTPGKSEARIGVMIPGLLRHESDSIFPHILQHIIRQAAVLGWQVLPGHPDLPGENSRDIAGCGPVEVARRLMANGINGAIIVPYAVGGQGDSFNHNVLTEFASRGIPVVLLDRDIVESPGRSRHDLVCMDHGHAGYELGRHLLAKGCRRFVFVSQRIRFPTPRLRLAGLRHAIAENGLELPDARVLQAPPDDAKLASAILGRWRADAVVCDNDLNAALVMRSLQALGAKIPRAIKIAGFDNAPVAKVLAIPLTTVAQPAAGLAAKALFTLRDRIKDQTLPPCTVLLQGRLIVRKSTG